MNILAKPMSTTLTMRDIADDWRLSDASENALKASMQKLCRRFDTDGALLVRLIGNESGAESLTLASHGIDPALMDAVVERAIGAVARKGQPETLPVMVPAWRIGGAAACIYVLPASPKAHGQMVTACLSLEQKTFAELAELFLAARCIMNGLDALPSGGDDDRPRISVREQACLAWTAEGKTSEEIGIILQLSPHTVNHYLGSAARKLGASNRMHAVAKALRLGLISRPV